MKLKETEWTDQPRTIEVEYPDAIVTKFVNWLRGTRAWHEDVEMVHRNVLALNRELAEYRQAHPPVQTMAAPQPASAAPPVRSRKKAKEPAAQEG